MLCGSTKRKDGDSRRLFRHLDRSVVIGALKRVKTKVLADGEPSQHRDTADKSLGVERQKI